MNEGSPLRTLSSSFKFLWKTHSIVARGWSRLVYSCKAVSRQVVFVLPRVMNLIFTIVWDPPREIFSFNIPLLNRPILWYGFFFALGFFLGFWALRYLLGKREDLSFSPKEAAERITLAVLIGGVAGARIGDLIFYQHFTSFLKDPLSLFKIWEGGLASHGGGAGILVALFLLAFGSQRRRLRLSFLSLLDLVVIPAALAGALIRVGNLFNQEILGTPTALPWGFLFLHPADGSLPLVRHPVQLYESLYYLALFFTLLLLWRFRPSFRKEGRSSALFLILLFGFRFLIEFVKEEQSIYLLPFRASLTMGQLLSLPFILLGMGIYPNNFKNWFKAWPKPRG